MGFCKKVIDEIKALTGTLPLFNKFYLAVDDSRFNT